MSGLGLLKPITKREESRIKNALGRLAAHLAGRNAVPNPSLAKRPTERVETRFYSKADLLRRWLKRGEKRGAEGELAGAILNLPNPYEKALREIRISLACLDSFSEPVRDIQNRIADLIAKIDAASAEPQAVPEVPA